MKEITTVHDLLELTDAEYEQTDKAEIVGRMRDRIRACEPPSSWFPPPEEEVARYWARIPELQRTIQAQDKAAKEQAAAEFNAGYQNVSVRVCRRCGQDSHETMFTTAPSSGLCDDCF